jgi:hypothetical protein
MSDETWVEVRDEPRHHRRFENDYARVYDVRVAPSERTLFHRHTEDTFYVSIEAARIEDQTFGESESRTNDVPAGIAICRPHREEPLIHRVRNVGQTGMRMIGAEVSRSPEVTAEKALESPGHTLQWETPRMRAYLLELAPGECTGEVRYGFSGLSVALSEGNLSVHDAAGATRTAASARGDVVWHECPLSFELTNAGEEPFRAYLAEWR